MGTGVRSTSSNRLPESGSITGSNNKRSPFPVRFTICKAGTAVGLAPDQAVAADTLTPTKIDISVRIVLEAATTHAEARRAMRIWSGRRKRCVNVTWFAVRKPENSGNRRKRSCCLREPTPRVSIVSCLAAFRAVAACRCICGSRDVQILNASNSTATSPNSSTQTATASDSSQMCMISPKSIPSSTVRLLSSSSERTKNTSLRLRSY